MIPAEAERLVPVISDAVTSTGPKPIPARGGGAADRHTYPLIRLRGLADRGQQPNSQDSPTPQSRQVVRRRLPGRPGPAYHRTATGPRNRRRSRKRSDGRTQFGVRGSRCVQVVTQRRRW